MFSLRAVGLLFTLVAFSSALGDEAVRQVQEELRRRNLYFGDVDGRATPELSGAIKRYQERKGFEASGMLNSETATSLGIRAEVGEATMANWPEIPVLRSDNARDLPEPSRMVLQQKAEDDPDAVPKPPPPAESPAPAQHLSREQVQELVENYLRNAETDDVVAQIRYFSYPLEYLWHGQRGRDYVLRDFRNYVKRWPKRRYWLTGPVEFYAASGGDETIVEFPMGFDVQNARHHVTGRTWNVWAIRPVADELKIVSIWEERLRN